jgi:hypothetical protein
LCTEGVLKGDNVFAKNVQNLHITFAAMTGPAEGIYLNALLVQKVGNSLFAL